MLRTVGRWLKVNGEAVYGAGPTPFGEELGEPSARGPKDLRGNPLFLPRNEWRVTTKPGKLYFTFFEEPRVPFELPAMKNAVKRAYRLADGAAGEGRGENGRPRARDRASDLRPHGDRGGGRDRRAGGRASPGGGPGRNGFTDYS